MFPFRSAFRKDLSDERISQLAYIRFVSFIALALVSTIWAVYLNSFLNDAVQVGLLSSLFTFILFLSFLFIIPIVEKFDKSFLFLSSVLILSAVFFMMGLFEGFLIFFILSIVFLFVRALGQVSYGIMIKHHSKRNCLVKNEGFIYTLLNLSWLIGPLIAGYASFIYGFQSVFLIAGFFMFLCFVLFKKINIHDFYVKKRNFDKRLFKNIKDFFSRKERVVSYFISGGLSVWWAMIFLFMPLYIIRNGLNEIFIGYFFVAIAVPLVLFESYFCKLTHNKGFKRFFKTGYFLIFVFSIICFFISNIYFIIFLLVLASIGVAMIEPSSEAYFFDITKGKQDLRFYPIYNTTIVFHEFLGRVFGSVILIFLPFKYLFLFFGFFMLIMFFISSGVRKIAECKRRS